MALEQPRANPPRFTPYARRERERTQVFNSSATPRMAPPPGDPQMAGFESNDPLLPAQREMLLNASTEPGQGGIPYRDVQTAALNTSDPESYVEDFLSELSAEEALNDPVLGSPFLDDMGQPGEVPGSFFGQTNRYLPRQFRLRSPNYRQTDVALQWSRLPLEARLRASRHLKQLGFTSTTNGQWNQGVQQGVTAAMSYANMNGLGWTDALQSLAQQAAEVEDEVNEEARQSALDRYNYLRDNFIDEPYLAPDYDSISGDVRGLFQQRLGRRPNDWEVELLAESFTDSHRRRWEAENQASREAELNQLALNTNADFASQGLDPALPLIEGEEGVDEDPFASMQSEFERLYSSAIDTEDDEAESQSIEASIEGASNVVRSLLGG